jgi:hypothetical protein
MLWLTGAGTPPATGNLQRSRGVLRSGTLEAATTRFRFTPQRAGPSTWRVTWRPGDRTRQE